MELPLLLYVYYFLLLSLSIFGFHRYYLVYLHHRYRSRQAPPILFDGLPSAPRVTVQLPIYNEQYVLPRLLEAVCALDYPKDRLQIQLLDDSTDETVNLSRSLVDQYRAAGFPIEWLHRTDRAGFKAGALNEGLKTATGEFIAIFDADFVPAPDFLKKLIPHFTRDRQVGMVQARWEHLNRDFSWLTEAQAIFLDSHFVIEHAARNRSGCFFNFNGTAGVWRRQCLEVMGGWSAETLTEDLHLSYKAQMGGWRFLFLPDVTVPAELPVDVNAFRVQQHRWAKGSIQTAFKVIPQILKGPYPWGVKVEACFHLLANFCYFLLFFVAILMPFTLYVKRRVGWEYWLVDVLLFLGATFSFVSFYFYSQKASGNAHWRRSLKYIPFNLSLGIGLCVNNAFAVMDALVRGNGGVFVRTPKYAVERKGDSWRGKKYRAAPRWINLFETALAVHYSYALYYGVTHKLYFFIPFILLFQVGFLYISIQSLSGLWGRFVGVNRWHFLSQTS